VGENVKENGWIRTGYRPRTGKEKKKGKKTFINGHFLLFFFLSFGRLTTYGQGKEEKEKGKWTRTIYWDRTGQGQRPKNKGTGHPLGAKGTEKEKGNKKSRNQQIQR
jgi:hypothetical protein